MLTSRIAVIHDNASDHSTRVIQRHLQEFQWDIFLFPKLKQWLGKRGEKRGGRASALTWSTKKPVQLTSNHWRQHLKTILQISLFTDMRNDPNRSDYVEN